jgi:hypothetical protein
MAVFLFDVLAMLLFIAFADFSRFRPLVPVLITGVFFRFLEHFIVVDWLELWRIKGAVWRKLWLPISADVTVWPVACYFFIQYIPQKGRVLYGAAWVAAMLVYLQLLVWTDVIFMKGWNLFYSAIIISLYFTLIYFLWEWLKQAEGKGRHEDGT